MRAGNSAAQVSTARNVRSPANGASGSSASACSSRRNHGSMRRALVHGLDAGAAREQLEHGLEALRSGGAEALQQRLVGDLVQGRRLVELARAQRLGERLCERAADHHRLAHGLHVRGQRGGAVGELLEGEPRPLDDDVVDRRLEAGRRDAGDVVVDLIQAVADGQARGDLGDREARRLGGQR